MKNAIHWFEIFVKDMDRAIRFYERVLGATLRRETFGGLPNAIFPADEGAVRGALVADPKRAPGGAGPLVYLGTDDLDGAIGRVKDAGGTVELAKTSIGPFGFIASFVDPEGNRVALHAEVPKP